MKTLMLFCCALLTVTGAAAQKTKKPAAKPVAKAVAKPVSKTVAAVTKTFPNGISMTIKGFKVSEAALYFEDGTAVPENNTIELNQKVIMYAVLDSGYKVIGGKVFPGGSERIVLSNGYEVLNTEDLFGAYADGVTPEAGKYISLKAMMTELNDKSNTVQVSFKIWDKKGSSLITGSYQLRIK